MSTNQMGIYQIRNLLNGKIYIGSTVDFNHRWRTHKSDLNKQVHHSFILQRAWNKYGETNFVFDVLEIVNKKSQLRSLEQTYLNKFHPEYNVSKSASTGRLGKKNSKEHIRKFSKSMKGRKFTKEHREKISQGNLGREVSDSTRIRLSKSLSGRKLSEEHKRKLSKKFSGEGNSFSKLTWKEVRKIRSLYKSGNYTWKELGKMFDVHKETITCIVKNKTWIETK